jgi:hypothetical protein
MEMDLLLICYMFSTVTPKKRNIRALVILGPQTQDLIKLLGHSRPNSNSISQSSDVRNDRTTMVDNHAAKPRAGTNGTWL